jgi:predicted Zn-dependent protease
MKNENYVSAEETFNKALKLYKDSTSLLRLKIHLAYAMNNQGNKKDSLKILNDLSKEYSGSVEADAVALIFKNIEAGK